MRHTALTLLAGAAALALAACGDTGADNEAANAADNEAAAAEGDATTTASASWPSGARIVEEDGVTFRVDPDGSRVRLTDTDSRIVVENGVRFRVDPDGSRVRIDETGLDVDVDAPDVDVGVNEKGNLDVDVDPIDVDVTENRSR